MDDVLISADDLTFAVVVMPPVIALINQRAWPKEVKGLVGVVACMLYALAVAVYRDELHASDWRNIVLQVGVGTFAAYRLFWGPTNIGPRIEAGTSVGAGRAAPVGIIDSHPTAGTLYDEIGSDRMVAAAR